MTSAQLNTTDLPEVDFRAPREKSKHWAMRSGPRRFVSPDAGQQNDWLRRADLLWGQEEEDRSLSPVPEEDGDRSEGEEETIPNATTELAAFLPAAGAVPMVLARQGRRFGRRGQRKQSGLSASWVWGTRSAATRVSDGCEATTADENGIDELQTQQQPEWPPLRRAAPGDENSDAWEVCSTVSSLASSWAVLQEEQSLLGLLPNDDAVQPEAAAAAEELREKKQEANADAASTSTPPVLSFAETVLLRPAVPVPAAATAGATALRASMMMTTTRSPKDDEKQEEPVAEARQRVYEEEDMYTHEEQQQWAGSLSAGAEEEKDGRGGHWTKESKGPRSLRQRERVAKACEKRRAVNPRGARDRGSRGPEDRESLDSAATSKGEETKREKGKVWHLRRELSRF